MSNLNGIQLAIELAAQRRDDYQKRLVAIERNQTMTLAQLEQLQSYAADKDSHWASPALSAFSGEILKHHFQFMRRLQEAIEMQSDVALVARSQVKEARLKLADAEARLEGLKRIKHMRANESAVKLKRQEQKQTDEFALQQCARKRAQTEEGEAV